MSDMIERYIKKLKQDIEGGMSASNKILDDLYNIAENKAKEDIKKNNISYVCKIGCSYCCNVPVSVMTYELFNITKYIKENNINVKKGILDACSRINRKSQQEWVNNNCFCPLLNKDKECMIYSVRPAMCRSVLSQNVDTCIKAFKFKEKRTFDPCIIKPQKEAYEALLHFITYVERDGCQLESRSIELILGLKISLSDENVFNRWLAGGDPFAAAELFFNARDTKDF